MHASTGLICPNYASQSFVPVHSLLFCYFMLQLKIGTGRVQKARPKTPT